jgi:uncharacterized protein YecE (DUF72 family)
MHGISAGYLGEYSKRFRTAEVDSFFYRLPVSRDVLAYAEAVDDDFRFTLKVAEDVSLTHERDRGSKDLEPNPSFLSAELFASCLDRVRALLPVTDAVMLEFEYLNKEKMRDVGAFMEALDPFISAVPAGRFAGRICPEADAFAPDSFKSGRYALSCAWYKPASSGTR